MKSIESCKAKGEKGPEVRFGVKRKTQEGSWGEKKTMLLQKHKREQRKRKTVGPDTLQRGGDRFGGKLGGGGRGRYGGVGGT